MEENTTFDELCAMAKAYCVRCRRPIGEKTRFKRDLKMDTVDFLDLILKVEKRFDCRLDDELLGCVENLGQLGLVLEKALEDKERN